jgi:hypothetical protein
MTELPRKIQDSPRAEHAEKTETLNNMCPIGSTNNPLQKIDGLTEDWRLFRMQS